MLAVDGDAVTLPNLVVCGTAGTPITTDRTTAAEQSAADRELRAVETALELAASVRTGPETPLYVLWHYPPFDAHSRPGPCVEHFERAGVTACVYGHLHNQSHWSVAVQGMVRGVRYHCVAADAIGFRPLKIG
jgi:predicted phosphohydrolase